MNSRPTRFDAVTSLCPTAEWAWIGVDYSGIVWHSPDIVQPTEAEIEAEHARLIAAWEAADYARKRQAEYPGLDQLIVALWEDAVEGRNTAVQSLQALREAIKQKYPKP